MRFNTKSLCLLVVLLFCIPIGTLAQSSSTMQRNKYGYPLNSKTGKITYKGVANSSVNKYLLFQNALQFIAVERFDKEVVIKTKNKKMYWTGKIVEKSITYSNEELGKIFGDGYFNFEYRGEKRFVITFNYKLHIEDNRYRYSFTNFVVKEFVDAGKAIGKTAATGSVATMASSARVLSFPLEEFVHRKRYDNSNEMFKDQIQKLIGHLKTAMEGQL